MTGADFLALAARLATAATEADWRTATSRAYYAAFHAARDLFEGLGFRVPHADQAHQYLYLRLYNCGHAALRLAADDLHTLRRRRNEADYDLRLAYDRQTAANLCALATSFLQALGAASIEPTRTQITTAMKDYERTVLHQVTWSPPPP
jgi:uncharacterized protein (UPF0332 family)